MIRASFLAPIGAAILLAGCGGGSTDAPAPANTSAPATEEIVPEETPVAEPSPSAAPVKTAGTGPSYDCTSPELGAAEHIICNVPELAKQDRQIAAAYARLKGQLLSHGKDALIEEQKEYLANRGACITERCIAMLQMERLDELKTAANP